eukprot:SAG31_NODE_447_length_15579_cov_5.713871_5_plen_36_part_00
MSWVKEKAKEMMGKLKGESTELREAMEAHKASPSI